ncbi:hypothetical protein Vadar_015150 [Vaccinium darrowii]|uniref:Uncharacterized protein n=1 Tax=Vaccinium darrowii TaxID=229202 RepID=A0ACB7Z5H7_9ERIC|nr:hypothetical protein Vadar_015150 [Vaccinium darrowii]
MQQLAFGRPSRLYISTPGSSNWVPLPFNLQQNEGYGTSGGQENYTWSNPGISSWIPHAFHSQQNQDNDDDIFEDCEEDGMVKDLVTVAMLWEVEQNLQLWLEKILFDTSPLTGKAYMEDLKNGHLWRFFWEFRMRQSTFKKIVWELENMYGWERSRDDSITCFESFAMFIWWLKGYNNPKIQERFQHSGETVSSRDVWHLESTVENVKKMPNVSLDDQARMVLVSMAIHNYIRRNGKKDVIFRRIERETDDVFEDISDLYPGVLDAEEDDNPQPRDADFDAYMAKVRHEITKALRKYRK